MLQGAWDAIALQGRKCDAVMRAHPNVELFVPSKTGVFKKERREGVNSRSIYKAVSYWMVTTPGLKHSTIQSTIIGRLHVVCARVNFKPITMQHRQPFDIAVAVSGTLYVVLKGHNSGYIRRRIGRSLPMLGDIRIVVIPSSKFRESILNPERTLLAVSLCADFLIADGLYHIYARVRRLACTYTGMHALT